MQAPAREAVDDAEAETYSTDAGTEGDVDAERRKRRPARKRRPKPEAIAARLKADVPEGSASTTSDAG
jgi:hypothetical protein